MEERPVRYGSATRKIADLFMELAPTTKVRVRQTRDSELHLIARESEMEDIYKALQERLKT